MRILVLSEGDARHPSVEHRVLWPLERLQSAGVVSSLVCGRLRRWGRSIVWWVGPACLVRAWRASAEADVLLVHRTAHLGVALLCWLVRWRRKIPIVFDFDDALYVRWHGPLSHPLYAGLPWVLRASKVAWCGSHALVDFAGRFTTAEWIPTPVAPVFRDGVRDGDGPPVIVWMGNGPVHLESLSILREPLERLARVSRFRLQIVSALGSEPVRTLFQSLAARVDVDFGWDTWQPVAELAARLQRADIGVMPLVDSRWSEGKCAIKALEAMAAGLPVVCSAVGENLAVAGIHSEHAMLARDGRQWYRALRALVCCPRLRQVYGQRGRARVQGRYDLESVVERMRASLGVEPASDPSHSA